MDDVEKVPAKRADSKAVNPKNIGNNVEKVLTAKEMGSAAADHRNIDDVEKVRRNERTPTQLFIIEISTMWRSFPTLCTSITKKVIARSIHAKTLSSLPRRARSGEVQARRST
jgi:hypothetical protein